MPSWHKALSLILSTRQTVHGDMWQESKQLSEHRRIRSSRSPRAAQQLQGQTGLCRSYSINNKNHSHPTAQLLSVFTRQAPSRKDSSLHCSHHSTRYHHRQLTDDDTEQGETVKISDMHMQSPQLSTLWRLVRWWMDTISTMHTRICVASKQQRVSGSRGRWLCWWGHLMKY